MAVSALHRAGLLLVTILLSCSPTANHSEHYDTRGLVRAFQGVGEARRVAIHHERIDRFVDREGKLSPMPSMPMLFALAKALEDAPLQVGDKVALGFDVHWDQSPTLVITKLDELPASTQLALSASH